MKFIKSLDSETRKTLRTQMHKVAAVIAKKDGIPLNDQEITLKTAAYAFGYSFWKNNLEKKTMLDGILSLDKLSR